MSDVASHLKRVFLQELTEIERIIFVLHYADGLSIEEVGEATGEPQSLIEHTLRQIQSLARGRMAASAAVA